MERLDFLSGKYKDGERIVPGAVQTFQAVEAASGRSVFVHRVPTAGADAQTAVIRLLSTALLRSAAVRKMVVEVADENGCCYVITENAEQCLLLREWLQFELDRASGQQAEEKPQAAPAVAPTAPVIPAVSAPPLAPEPVMPPPSPKEAEKAPGEFTRLFQVPQQAASASPVTPAPKPPEPAAAAPSRSETGEFTRFFRSDTLPEKKPEASRRFDRPSSSDGLRAPRNPGAVQRPANAPVPPLPQRSSDSGEMKRISSLSDFRRSSDTGEFHRSASGEFARLFSGAENSSTSLPAPPASQEPGEYTRIFGKGNSAPPLQQPAAPAPEPPANFDFLDSGSTGSTASEPLPRGPSEYTRIIGRSELKQTVPLPDAAPAAPPAGAAPAAPPAAMPAIPQVKLPAAPAMPAAPPVAAHVPLPKQVPMPAPAPASGNKRLIIFLIIIGILAVALIAAVILLGKK